MPGQYRIGLHDRSKETKIHTERERELKTLFAEVSHHFGVEPGQTICMKRISRAMAWVMLEHEVLKEFARSHQRVPIVKDGTIVLRSIA